MRPAIGGSPYRAIGDVPAEATGKHGFLCFWFFNTEERPKRSARNDSAVPDLSDLDPEELPRRHEMRVGGRRRYADNLGRVSQGDSPYEAITKEVEKVVWLGLGLTCLSLGEVRSGWACFVVHTCYGTS